MRIRVEGKSLESIERAYHRRLFDFYDPNKSGFLTARQAALAVRGDPLHRLLGSGGVTAFRLLDLDRDGDGKVSPDELARYCRARHRFLLVETSSFADPYARLLTKALFDALDINKDGKLSRAEVKAAPQVLARFDIDEDECLVPLELVPGLFTTRRSAPKKLAGPSLSVLLAPRKKGRPDLAVTVSLGDEERAADGVVLKSGAGRRMPGRVVVRLGKQELDLATGPAGEIQGQQRETLMKQFLAADRQRRGFVRVEDLQGAEFKLLRRLLPLADRDGDGKLTRAELTGYLDLQRLAEEGLVTLTVAAQERAGLKSSTRTTMAVSAWRNCSMPGGAWRMRKPTSQASSLSHILDNPYP